MAYCFDTSALIECWSRSYPPDVFRGLWDKMNDLAALTQIVAPEEVQVELAKQEDELHKWIEDRPYMLLPLDEALQIATAEVLRDHPLLMKATKNRNGADPFVIAAARIKGLTVVTEEQGGTDVKPKIPSVCTALGVPCIGVLQFLRQQGWTFS